MLLIRRRVGLLFALCVLGLAAAAAQSARLGVGQAGTLRDVARSQQVEQLVLPAHRGDVVDRRGTPLAVSEPTVDVSATPFLVRDPVRAARRLAPLLGRSEEELLRALGDRRAGFAYLARQVPAGRARAIDRLRLTGIDTVESARRRYPRAWLAAQVLGSTDIDGRGTAGIEATEDRVLRGRPGRRSLVRDARGRPIRVRDAQRTVDGERIRLTLDATLQTRVEEVLRGVGQRFRPKGATAIVLDPRDGDLLSVANWPQVDANAPGDAPGWARADRSSTLTFEPGSTFKAFTVAGALSEHLVTPDTSFVLPPTIQVADRTIGESHPRGTETMTTARILAQSSNVGSVRIGQKLGDRRFDAWVRRFGFGRPTGVRLSREERGIVPRAEDYSGSSIGNLPIGQGLAITPMQLAQGYAALANGGTLRRPRIVRAIGGRAVPPARGRRVVSSRTAAQVRAMLEGVVRAGGTASEVSVPGYTLAGKTGTANKVDAETGTYSKSRYMASFVGMAPARDPRLVVAVVVDEPKGSIYGGDVAGPAFEQILRFALPYLAIPPR